MIPAARLKDIVAFPREDGSAVAFHASNLQVARLDEEAWSVLRDAVSGAPGAFAGEAASELEAWAHEIDADVQDALEPSEVRYLSINVAQICNLKCGYCAAGGDGTFGDRVPQIDLDLAYERVGRFVRALPRGASFTLNFLGGEPLIVPQAVEAIALRTRLLAAGRGLDLSFRTVTNATLIGPETAEMLARLNFHVQVSLDGPPEVNDRSRPSAGGAGSTARALKGVGELFKRRDRLRSVSVNAVHGAHNSDALASYLFLREFPWDRISLTFDAGCKDRAIGRAYSESLARAAELAYVDGGERELRRIQEFNAQFETLDSRRRVRNYCGAGKSQALVDARGGVQACYWWAGETASNLLGRDGTLDAEGLARYSQDLVDRHGCGGCWARFVCGGGCMQANRLAHGDDRRKDDAFCERTKSLIAKGVDLYERARRDDGDGSRAQIGNV